MPAWSEQDQEELSKIAHADAGGMDATPDSLAYVQKELHDHFHNWERALGLAASTSGEVTRAETVTNNVAPFQIDAGNDTWGSWVQILGSGDTPAITGQLSFDLHKLNIVAVQVANVVYFIQIAFGATAAGALSAGTYTDIVFIPQSANGRPVAIPFRAARMDAGTKVWARCLARGTNTSTLDFYHVMHEYPVAAG